MDTREQLRRAFNDSFKTWKIELPIDALEPGVVWLIMNHGWLVWTRFGDEEGREYLDVLAAHRMTNERHFRMYSDGETVGLPAQLESFGYPGDAPEKERAEAKAKYFAYNRQVSKTLEEKGFVLPDDLGDSYPVSRRLQPSFDTAQSSTKASPGSGEAGGRNNRGL